MPCYYTTVIAAISQYRSLTEVIKMILLDFSAKTPIYEQIKEQVVFLVHKGVYAPFDQLPSIRALAAELGVNVNTVKRAFSELEESGVVYTKAGKGVFVSKGAVDNEDLKEKAMSNVKTAINSAMAMGVKKEELLLLIEELFNTI